MSHYNHITINERENILILKERGFSISKIAETLGRNKSTISRELKRNRKYKNEYSAIAAQKKYEKRRKNSRRKKILEDQKLKNEIMFLIRQHHWSPEEISNRMKLEKGVNISYNTIYRAIYDGTFEQKKYYGKKKGFERYLRHKGKKYHKSDDNETRGKIKISHDISERPQEANDRSEIGHWEADTVIGKAGEPCAVTLVDRKSRYSLIGRSEQKNAIEVTQTMLELLGRVDEDKIKTITPDRGKEFANHEEMTEKLNGIQFYFPQPHAPWARGTNENTNGLLREFCPKRTSMKDFNDDDFKLIELILNTRPRKCLNWKTPYEIFYNTSLHLT